MPKGALCGAPEPLLKDQEPFKDEDFASTLGGQIYLEEQRSQHWEAELILHSRDAQVTAASVQANWQGYQGASGMWNFRLGLPDGAMVRLQDDVIARVSFIILLVGAAWPWIVGIGICLGILQALASSCLRVCLVYQAKGFGLWLIPAAISMAFTILILPLSVLRHIWNSLGKRPEPLVAPTHTDDDLFTHIWQQCTQGLYPKALQLEEEGSVSGVPEAKRISITTAGPAAQ